jgi:hypothetical protein
MLKSTQEMEKVYEMIQKTEVAVGITEESATANVYNDGDGPSVLEVGANHEYGIGVPIRSFLRVPFTKRANDIDKFKAQVLKHMTQGGLSVNDGFGLLGEKLTNISDEAFENGGFGTWAPLSPVTIKNKGSTATLIDTGTLRNSVTYEVRDVD